MTLRPPDKLPPRRATCVLVYEHTAPGERPSIGWHDGARWHDAHNGGTGIRARLKGWCPLGRIEQPSGGAEFENDRLRQTIRDAAQHHERGTNIARVGLGMLLRDAVHGMGV